MPRALGIALCALTAVLIFGLGFLTGAREGMELIRQQAVDEGYAARESDGGIRWRSSDELTRKPARGR